MKSRLALGEPHTLTVRFPRLKSKDERLRDRATAYVRANMEPWLDYRYESRVPVWVEIRLNERKSVLARMKRIPWWRPLKRRRSLPLVLWTYGIPKWW